MNSILRFAQNIQRVADLQQPLIIQEVRLELEKRNAIKLVREQTDFNLEAHLRANQTGRTTGCGCKFCLSRMHYTNHKLNIHRIKRSFDRCYLYNDDVSNDIEKRYYEEIEYLKERRDNAKRTMEYWKEALGI